MVIITVERMTTDLLVLPCGPGSERVDCSMAIVANFLSTVRQNVKSVLMQEKIQPTHLLRGHDGAEVVLMFRNSLRFVTSISRDGLACAFGMRAICNARGKRHVIESSTTTRILDCVLLKMKGGLEVVIVATLDVGVTAYDAKTIEKDRRSLQYFHQ